MSRTKHRDAPKSFPVTAVFQSHEEVLALPVERLPILLHFPVFDLPRFLSGKASENGIEVLGLDTLNFGPHPAQLALEIGAVELRFQTAESPTDFARVLAKIAYAYAFAEGAVRYLDGPSFLVPSILGAKDDIGDWVGTIEGSVRPQNGVLHYVDLVADQRRGLLLAEIQLFSDSQSPKYVVVIGRLRAKDAS